MPFWKNHKRDKNEKSLNPVLHVMGSLKDYHTEMVQKEVDTLGELNNIGNSFNTVLADSEDFQEKLQDFGHNFSTIEQVSSEFGTVKETISQSVSHAQSGVEELKESSLQVKTYFSEMENTFADLQKAVEKIKSFPSPSRPIFWRLMPPSRRHGQANRGKDSLWWLLK